MWDFFSLSSFPYQTTQPPSLDCPLPPPQTVQLPPQIIFTVTLASKCCSQDSDGLTQSKRVLRTCWNNHLLRTLKHYQNFSRTFFPVAALILGPPRGGKEGLGPHTTFPGSSPVQSPQALSPRLPCSAASDPSVCSNVHLGEMVIAISSHPYFMLGHPAHRHPVSVPLCTPTAGRHGGMTEFHIPWRLQSDAAASLSVLHLAS